MKKLFTPLFLFLSIGLLGQNAVIKGVVTDQQTIEPLTGVSVSMLNTSTGTISDIDGKYELRADAGMISIVFSLIGYETQTVVVDLKADSTFFLNIAMPVEDILLNTIVVSGSKFEKKLSEEIVSLDVIKPDIIEKQNISDIGGAIKRNPGVTLVDGQINIRGGSGWSFGAGSRVLLLLDGLPVFNPASGGFGVSLPMESVGQIEIIKGAASALYGSSAMNGIVNLRTAYAKSIPQTQVSFFGSINDQPKQKEKYIDEFGEVQTQEADKRWWLLDSVTLKGGLLGKDTTVKNEDTNRPYKAGFSFSHRQMIKKFDLVMGGYYAASTTHIWGNDNKGGRFNVNTRYRFSTKWNAGINVNMNFGNSGNNFIWSGPKGVDKYIPASVIFPTTSKSVNAAFDPFAQYNDIKGNSHKLLGRYLYSNNKNTNNQSNLAMSYYGEYQYQRRLEKIGMTITSGAVGNLMTSPNSPLYGNADIKSSNLAFYAQADNTIWKKVHTSLGFRLETNKMTGAEREVKPVFRAGLNVQAAQYTFIRASFGQGYRFPSIAEKFVSTGLGGIGIVANPFLKSETGLSTELGIKQGVKLGRQFNAFLDAAGFYTQYTDMMEFTSVSSSSEIPVPPGSLINFASQNVGNTRIFGTDISLMGEGRLFGIHSTALVGYTFVVPQYRDFNESNTDDIVDYNVLKYRFRHTFTGQWDVDFKGVGLGANVQFYSFIENYDALFDVLGLGLDDYRQTLLKDNWEEKKVQNRYKGSAVWDLRASYTIDKKNKYTFALLVNNVLNKEYTLRPGVIESNRTYTFRVDLKF